ncbi:MAG: hypothetical protein H6821_12720 [Planctomycetaceae bacterium]|nr:hypothetical protein [Planctomycetales bacterium]MCB9875033.1 hypothetical protein [Planctomycetaceae bacterium]MCB9940102.1 hypothetical protein [Planctomycetaceae bacterium]HRX77527.1 hypothetical protein [Pirellulaceae bacterium]
MARPVTHVGRGLRRGSQKPYRATTRELIHAEVHVSYVVIDVHKDSIAIAVAEQRRDL